MLVLSSASGASKIGAIHDSVKVEIDLIPRAGRVAMTQQRLEISDVHHPIELATATGPMGPASNRNQHH
jgi:hypothetical protein